MFHHLEHTICMPCLDSYVTSRLTKYVANSKMDCLCGCGEDMSEEDTHNASNWAQIYGKARLEQQCPHCASPWVASGKHHEHLMCPMCTEKNPLKRVVHGKRARVCLFCKAPLALFSSHQCVELDLNALREYHREVNQQPGQAYSLIKPCPICYTLILRNEGCPHMSCRACRARFCWDFYQDLAISRKCSCDLKKTSLWGGIKWGVSTVCTTIFGVFYIPAKIHHHYVVLPRQQARYKRLQVEEAVRSRGVDVVVEQSNFGALCVLNDVPRGKGVEGRLDGVQVRGFGLVYQDCILI